VAITLGDGVTELALPDNLLWEDELAWDPVRQSRSHALDGALLIEEWARQAGRPITLSGGSGWSWMTRADVLALQTLIAPAGVELTLTLHDAREFSVTPARDGEGALRARQLPTVGDSGDADPQSGSWYILEQLRVVEI
jgi:hypothetical protein